MNKVNINTHEYGPGQRLSYQEDILKKYITVDNVRYYREMREDMVSFTEYGEEYNKMVDILDNVLKDFLER